MIIQLVWGIIEKIYTLDLPPLLSLSENVDLKYFNIKYWLRRTYSFDALFPEIAKYSVYI